MKSTNVIGHCQTHELDRRELVGYCKALGVLKRDEPDSNLEMAAWENGEF